MEGKKKKPYERPSSAVIEAERQLPIWDEGRDCVSNSPNPGGGCPFETNVLFNKL
jgi:hypothetical protein